MFKENEIAIEEESLVRDELIKWRGGKRWVSAHTIDKKADEIEKQILSKTPLERHTAVEQRKQRKIPAAEQKKQPQTQEEKNRLAWEEVRKEMPKKEWEAVQQMWDVLRDIDRWNGLSEEEQDYNVELLQNIHDGRDSVASKYVRIEDVHREAGTKFHREFTRFWNTLSYRIKDLPSLRFKRKKTSPPPRAGWSGRTGRSNKLSSPSQNFIDEFQRGMFGKPTREERRDR